MSEIVVPPAIPLQVAAALGDMERPVRQAAQAALLAHGDAQTCSDTIDGGRKMVGDRETACKILPVGSVAE